MLILRLKRIGKKHQAAFRLVVGERRSKLKGDYTEDLGWYNPRIKKAEFKADRVKYWLSVGAKLSDTVHNLLVGQKIIEGKKIASHKSRRSAEVGTPTKASEKPAAVAKPTAASAVADSAAGASAKEAAIVDKPAEKPAEAAPSA